MIKNNAGGGVTKTLLTPDNDAFSNLRKEVVTKFTQNGNYLLHLKNLLQYYLVNGRVLSTKVKNELKLKLSMRQICSD